MQALKNAKDITFWILGISYKCLKDSSTSDCSINTSSLSNRNYHAESPAISVAESTLRHLNAQKRRQNALVFMKFQFPIPRLHSSSHYKQGILSKRSYIITNIRNTLHSDEICWLFAFVVIQDPGQLRLWACHICNVKKVSSAASSSNDVLSALFHWFLGIFQA